MSTAQRWFVGYGVVVLLVALLLGTVLGTLRMRSPAIRTLTAAHVETLLQAPLHLALAFAVGAVGFDSTAAAWAAALFVIGSAMQATGATVNWLTNTEDQFAQRSIGWRLNSSSTFVMWPGAVLIAWGILSRL